MAQTWVKLGYAPREASTDQPDGTTDSELLELSSALVPCWKIRLSDNEGPQRTRPHRLPCSTRRWKPLGGSAVNSSHLSSVQGPQFYHLRMGSENFISPSAKASDLGFLLRQQNFLGPTRLIKTGVEENQATGSTWLCEKYRRKADALKTSRLFPSYFHKNVYLWCFSQYKLYVLKLRRSVMLRAGGREADSQSCPAEPLRQGAHV